MTRMVSATPPRKAIPRKTFCVCGGGRGAVSQLVGEMSSLKLLSQSLTLMDHHSRLQTQPGMHFVLN